MLGSDSGRPFVSAPSIGCRFSKKYESPAYSQSFTAVFRRLRRRVPRPKGPSLSVPIRSNPGNVPVQERRPSHGRTIEGMLFLVRHLESGLDLNVEE